MIYRFALFILYFFIAVIIQGLFPVNTNIIPDFILLGIVAIACIGGEKEGFIGGVIGGILQDLTTVLSGGFFTLIKCTLALLISLIKFRMVPDLIIIPFILGFLSTLLQEWGFYGTTNLTHWKTLHYNFKEHILPSAIINAALSPLIFLLFKKIVYTTKKSASIRRA